MDILPISARKWIARRLPLLPMPGNRHDLRRQALNLRAKHTAPLVLISQLPRSGGTLLSQLFDGHPALRAHPHELKIGKPHKSIWPEVTPDMGPRRCFAALLEKVTYDLVAGGYRKGNDKQVRLRFLFDLNLQRKLFLAGWAAHSPATRRAILDLYFDSYFGAWLNYRGGQVAADYVTGFAAGLALNPDSVARFFRDYPEGFLISILRDPVGWYASARDFPGGKGRFTGLDQAAEAWRANAEVMRANRRAYGERVVLLDFEDLVGRTGPTMRLLAQRLGIDYSPILTAPTFNEEPVAPNSSFGSRKGAVDRRTLVRAETLEHREIAALLDRTGALHDRVRAMTDRPKAEVVPLLSPADRLDGDGGEEEVLFG